MGPEGPQSTSLGADAAEAFAAEPVAARFFEFAPVVLSQQLRALDREREAIPRRAPSASLRPSTWRTWKARTLRVKPTTSESRAWPSVASRSARRTSRGSTVPAVSTTTAAAATCRRGGGRRRAGCSGRPGRAADGRPRPRRGRGRRSASPRARRTGPARMLAVRPDDRRCCPARPTVLLGEVACRDEPVAVREVGRDPVDVEDRVDADDEHPVLACEVPHRRDPGVARSRASGASQSRRPGRTCGSAPGACSSPSRSARRSGRRACRRRAASSRRPCPTPSAPDPVGTSLRCFSTSAPSGER